MFKNQWYAVEFGHRVGTGPHGVRALGQDLVLYRSASGVVAQSDLCVHRGAKLSLGRMTNGCIECPYHGWQYDDAGHCVKIPANRGDLPVPKKARVDTYPAVERYGYIWVFLGDAAEADRPSLPALPYLDVVAAAQISGYRAVTGEFRWEANWERVAENAVDIAHTPFVHSTSFGNRDKPEIDDFELTGLPNAAVATVHLEPPPPGGIWSVFMKKKDRPPVKTSTGLFFPNMTMLEVNLSIGQMLIFTAAVPVDEHTTISKYTMLRSFFTGKWADRDSQRRTIKIFLEDQPTVESQRPGLVPTDLAAELHAKSDSIQLAFRRWRQGQIEAGAKLVPSGAGTSVGLIASPARRTDVDQQWVFPERASERFE